MVKDATYRPKASASADKPKSEGAKRVTGLTADVKLSPELAAIVGQSVMPRTQVVKKMWAIFKERGLQDPSDKRYILVKDADMKKVFPNVENGRLLGFGLLKHLKAHMTTMWTNKQPANELLKKMQ